MNILIPDSWLRECLETKATPEEIKKYLSLCGPSVERIHTTNGEPVYDIEVTTNRVDSMSVVGIAREAAAILPEFKITAIFKPITKVASLKEYKNQPQLEIDIIDNDTHCNRILAVKISNVTLGPSPAWLKKRLNEVGQRPLNNVIDITNYVMWELGHPVHAFDYDRLTRKKIIVRPAKKGEKLITLDNKQHTLRGGELIFDDGTGNIIDLPGIMGTQNTVVTDHTKNILLFIENSDAVKIRYASMGLSIRTQAAVLNEKSPDPELAFLAIQRTTKLYQEVCKGEIASKLFDTYPHKVKPKPVTLSKTQLHKYMGLELPEKRVTHILETLGCSIKTEPHNYEVIPPTGRVNDMVIAEDVIEEIARIYGYHNITSKLPDGDLPEAYPDKTLIFEEEIKIRLRDWGFTETYTYSMISEELMDMFQIDRKKAYKIANPLSSEWSYMRPLLLPSLLTAVKENLHYQSEIKLFELSMVYNHRENNLPDERPMLGIIWSGSHFLEAKGLAESLLRLLGIPFLTDQVTSEEKKRHWNPARVLTIERFGAVGEVDPQLTSQMGIKGTVTALVLDFSALVNHVKMQKQYTPISKYPPIIEDMTFVFPEKTRIDEVLTTIKNLSPLVHTVDLKDQYETAFTFRINYHDATKPLTQEKVITVRKQLVSEVEKKFKGKLKG